MKRFIAAIGLVSVLAPTVFAGGRIPHKQREQSLPVRVTAHKQREQSLLARVTAHKQREQSLLARVTVYWASGGRGSDSYTRRHQCSTGVRLRVGHCAVDPRRIPYGSKVVLPDGVFTAVDTGGAVVSRKAARRSGRTASERNALVIDRFFETKRQALSWANAHPEFMTVQVIPPNYYRAATAQQPQRSRQPAPQVAAGTVPQTKRITSAYVSAGSGRVRR